MGPTFEARASFVREFARLSREQDKAFRTAVRKLIDALQAQREPPRSLRLEGVQGTKDVWEMSYSGDGRPTFRSSAPQVGDQLVAILWRWPFRQVEVEVVAAPAIEKRIFVIRERQVMLDEDLADLHGVETKRLVQ